MKTLTTMKYILFLLLISCSKTTVTEPMKADSIRVVDSVSVQVGGTSLVVRLDPILTCQSYKDNDPVKYCDIFVYATIKVLNPIDKGIKIEFSRGNEHPVIIVAPMTKEVTLNTGIRNSSTTALVGQYYIDNVSTFKLNY